MEIIDISRPLTERTAPWPGDVPFSMTWRRRIAEGHPVNLTTLTLSPHVGTHVDAPLHVRDGAPGAGELDLEPFLGPARVISVRPSTGGTIPASALERFDLSDPPRILLKTGTHDGWTKWRPRFAFLSPSCAAALAGGGARLVGIDTPGIDEAESKDLPAHKILADGGVRSIENLDLRAAAPGLYRLIALPLPIHGADASPVRAVLVKMYRAAWEGKKKRGGRGGER